ncbi:ABC transporter substrate-binding protein [Lacibacterium aquatile]|uniref:ABC transporter substrate-binding protein n=1 Tax=Lacibacterium aquatile TaxID=1168082 RepID=A0ABW5DPT8_9PROT
MLRKFLMASAALSLLAAAPVGAQTLRFGLSDDPDALDPTTARTFVGRIVFGALCDKLMDITPDLTVVPQLATEWSWGDDAKSLTMKLRPNVTFHDGEKFDAEAVKYNIERHLTMQGSQRRAEIASISTVDVIDPLTVKLNLKAPFAPLLAALTDRAGMMISPKAGKALGDKFSSAPVCAGPYKFVERVAQDRIVVEKFDNYWDAKDIAIKRIEFRPFTDASVKLANLKAGQLDMIERVSPTDVAEVKKDSKLKLGQITELGYRAIRINTNNGERAKSVIGSNEKVREAFELSLDRDAIVQVVSNGEFMGGNQWLAPTNPNYVKKFPVPQRDVNKAKALLKEAGVATPVVVNLMTTTTTENQQVAQIIQAMAAESGFDVKIQSTEFATSLQLAEKGDFELYIQGWSGRTDPDGNLYSFIATGAGQNDGRYSNAKVDEMLKVGRETTALAVRRKAYEEIADVTLRERPFIYLYHQKWLWAFNNKVTGFKEYPDGLVRFTNLKLN